jgi:chromosome segregation ATPase
MRKGFPFERAPETSGGRDSLLDVVARLEADDARVASQLALTSVLLERAGAVGGRARELDTALTALPDERAVLEGEEAAAEAAAAGAQAALAEAERRLAELGSSRRDAKKREQSEREVAHAVEAVSDAERRIERVGERRGQLGEDERRWRAEIPELAASAVAAARELDELPGVSESGRAQPESDLAGLAAWADRVRAALLVVRSRLEGERERLVREASELGAAVLGEPVDGASVERVRRRVEQALRR